MEQKEEKKERSEAWMIVGELTKQNKRMFVIIISALVLWFSTIFCAFWFLNNYEYKIETYDFDTGSGGNANYIGNDGDIYNGKNDSN